MKTTLGKIEEYRPCQEGWDKLTSVLGTDDLNAEVTLKFILESNGVLNMLWALRCLPELPPQWYNFMLYLENKQSSILAYVLKYYPCHGNYCHAIAYKFSLIYCNDYKSNQDECIEEFAQWWKETLDKGQEKL